MHYLYKKCAGVILLEFSLLFDSLNIFYNFYLRLIQQYSTMIEVLVNSSERPLRKFLTLFPNLISRVGQMIFYLQRIVFVSDLGFYCDIGNNSSCSFQTILYVCLIWSFFNQYMVTLKFRRVQVLQYPFQILFLSPKSHCTHLCLYFYLLRSQFLPSPLMITISPALTCCSFP